MYSSEQAHNSAQTPPRRKPRCISIAIAAANLRRDVAALVQPHGLPRWAPRAQPGRRSCYSFEKLRIYRSPHGDTAGQRRYRRAPSIEKFTRSLQRETAPAEQFRDLSTTSRSTRTVARRETSILTPPARHGGGSARSPRSSFTARGSPR
jgi:hypothetical protein